ncbi:hypothetical protein B0H19DRAFT_888689, partial [Mycena capillaripes]
LIYLPTYSPDSNPIEQAFHSWLRVILPDVRPWLIQQAAMAITPEDAENLI